MQMGSSIGNSFPQYGGKYAALIEFIEKYNRGEVNPRLLGRTSFEKLKYVAVEIDAVNQPAAYFRTDQPTLLKRLIDKCDEWFVHGDYTGGVFTFLKDQDVRKVKVPKRIAKMNLANLH